MSQKNSTVQMYLPGISSSIQAVNEKLKEASANDRPVFLTGEVGTEKAFAAKLIHQLSPRAARPLSKISVSWKLPPDLSLYVKACNQGTLLIHLQKEFPVDMQYTLVELATDSTFTDPLSGESSRADVRMILMTSMTLDGLNARNPMLPELRDLLGSQHIEIPPLRERIEDIPAVVRYAIKRANDTGKSPAIAADAQVLTLYRQWNWPGNVEDLMLVTAQAAINCKSEQVTLTDLPEAFLKQFPAEMLEIAKSVRPSPVHARGAAPISKASADAVSIAEFQSNSRPAILLPLPEQLATFPTPAQVQQNYELSTTKTPLTISQPNPAAVPVSETQHPSPLSPRLLQLAKRLNAQSTMLSRQLTGPLTSIPQFSRSQEFVPFGPPTNPAEVEVLSSLEKELDRGLDLVLSLRRQMAVLNVRQQQSAETLRDIVLRIAESSEMPRDLNLKAEVKQDAEELARNLSAIDAIIKRVSSELPALGQQLASTTPGAPATLTNG